MTHSSQRRNQLGIETKRQTALQKVDFHETSTARFMLQRISLVAQMVKCLPTVRETWVQSLGWEDLEKESATHSSILAWKIPWMEEPSRLQSMGSQRVGHDWTCKELVMLQNGATYLRKQNKRT